MFVLTVRFTLQPLLRHPPVANTFMLDLYDDSAFVHDLLAFTVELGLRYGKAQIDAGADIIGIGDAAASLIGPKSYEKYVWPYERKLVDGLQAMGATVRLHICGNTKSIVDGMGRLGCEIVDLDYFTPVDSARVAGIQLLCIQPTCI